MLATREQTLAYLRFFRTWDDELGDEAARTFSRLRREAAGPDAFAQAAAAGSRERELVERHLAPFTADAGLIAAGQMHAGMFFDGWYEVTNSWRTASPWIPVLRADRGDPTYGAEVERLARAYERFREAATPEEQTTPLDDEVVAPLDAAIFEEFDALWHGSRDAEAWTFFDDLTRVPRDYAGFRGAVPRGSIEWTRFDRIMCAYDQAGNLMKRGLLHPMPFFERWRSPGSFWERVSRWVFVLRAEIQSTHLYEGLDWLADFERSRSRT
jgi:hypothetical protein